jgi:hypothetical protein
LTKGIFLKKLATIFDPLGLLSPYVIRGKVLMQEILVQGHEWDDVISTDFNRKAKVWLDDLLILGQVKIPRFIRMDQ